MTKPTRIFDLIAYQQEQFPTIAMFSYKEEDRWVESTAIDIQQEANALAKGLIAKGILPGDKVALISENRVAWNIIDFAIQQVGAVVVGMYPNISKDDYEYILKHAEVKLAIVSNKSLYEKIEGQLADLYIIDGEPSTPHWNELKALGTAITDSELQQRKAAVLPSDIATLIYTSGTTGTPKGVMLSHTNLLADVMSSEYSFPVTAYDRALSFLPVCHAYERVFHYVYIYKGVTIYFAQSMDSIGADIKAVKPHIFSAVPRVLEKIYDKIVSTGDSLTGVKRKIFFWAISVGEKYTIEGRSPWYNLKLAVAQKLVFSKFREALGGELKGVASGSAALQERLIRLYMAAGIPIFEGYGLTEAGPCLSVNCYKRGMRIGTVGVPLINIEIKLAEDGEILAKGENIMVGYYKDQKATDEVLKDGWLSTGDIGTWVDHKYLKIIDRKKEMFKTSGGKYIVPQQIESKLVESVYIEQAMVVGEGQKFPGAVIVPAYEALKAKFKPAETLKKEDFLKLPEVNDFLEKQIAVINNKFGHWEQIKRIAVIPTEFTIEAGDLTPTLKMKRKQISAKYKAEIDALYAI
ncbi:long-chain fatty acid--CoA ligase [Sphingobacteriaceae bacterium WQ 2009]|uniref:Long-chain fatty acid--CoA ligase n=1 Tax=Rhinopithecimicrobium faecis TaxID=2820698 RepID=A0A8T4HBW3_9SPHI|nr:long-chain fatty acid--CoA ligase [Sphingobacteriaceae bacterium WQ 2009]